jgi:hypothetical protein
MELLNQTTDIHAGDNSYQEKLAGNNEYLDNTGYRDHKPTERLLELHSFLLKESRHITFQKTGDFNQYTQSTVYPIDSMHISSACLDTAVHTALSSSEQFLDILKNFNLKALPDSQPLSLRLATNLSTTALQEAFSIDEQPIQGVPPCTLSTPFEDNGSLYGTNSTTNYNPEDQHDRFPFNERQKEPDIPTSLTLVSCYICLIRIYNVLFTRILESLITCISMTGYPTPMTPDLPFSGVSPNGIDVHRTMQLQMLIRVSTHMLTLIEEQLGLSGPQCVGEPGAVSVSVVLLDSLSQYEEATFGSSPKNTKISLERTIETMKQFLGVS